MVTNKQAAEALLKVFIIYVVKLQYATKIREIESLANTMKLIPVAIKVLCAEESEERYADSN